MASAGSFGSSTVPSTVSMLVIFSLARRCRSSVEHLRLDVVGVDLAGRADALRHLHRHVAGAGADVGDRRPLLPASARRARCRAPLPRRARGDRASRRPDSSSAGEAPAADRMHARRRVCCAATSERAAETTSAPRQTASRVCLCI